MTASPWVVRKARLVRALPHVLEDDRRLKEKTFDVRELLQVLRELLLRYRLGEHRGMQSPVDEPRFPQSRTTRASYFVRAHGFVVRESTQSWHNFSPSYRTSKPLRNTKYDASGTIRVERRTKFRSR